MEVIKAGRGTSGRLNRSRHGKLKRKKIVKLTKDDKVKISPYFNYEEGIFLKHGWSHY